MDYDSLLLLSKNCRTVRRYTPEPIPVESIMKALDVARWAPSGDNTQPWEFIIVKDPDQAQQLRDILAEGEEQIRERCPRFTFIHTKLQEMSTFILVCADTRFKLAYPRSPENDDLYAMYEENSERIMLESVSIAVTYLRLAITSLGFGSVWISGAAEDITSEKIKKAFGIPQDLRIFCCIAAGCPAKGPQNPLITSGRRPRPLESVVHIDKFDSSKWRTSEDVAKHTSTDRSFHAQFYKTGTTYNTSKQR